MRASHSLVSARAKATEMLIMLVINVEQGVDNKRRHSVRYCECLPGSVVEKVIHV